MHFDQHYRIQCGVDLRFLNPGGIVEGDGIGKDKLREMKSINFDNHSIDAVFSFGQILLILCLEHFLDFYFVGEGTCATFI